MCQWKWKSWRKDSKSRTLVGEWLASADKFVREEFTESIKYLDGQPPANWKRPFVDGLHGGKKSRKSGCKGLVEIRFEVNNVQYRPLGYYSDEMEFTILLIAKEVGGKFEPLAACEIAKNRILEIEADKDKAHEFWFTKRESGKHNCRQGISAVLQ